MNIQIQKNKKKVLNLQVSVMIINKIVQKKQAVPKNKQKDKMIKNINSQIHFLTSSI